MFNVKQEKQSYNQIQMVNNFQSPQNSNQVLYLNSMIEQPRGYQTLVNICAIGVSCESALECVAH